MMKKAFILLNTYLFFKEIFFFDNALNLMLHYESYMLNDIIYYTVKIWHQFSLELSQGINIDTHSNNHLQLFPLLYLYMYIYKFVYVCICMGRCVCIYIYIYIYIYIVLHKIFVVGGIWYSYVLSNLRKIFLKKVYIKFILMHIYLYLYIFIYMHVHVLIDIYIYAHTYIHTHEYTYIRMYVFSFCWFTFIH